jgi:hypothetical protein
MSTKIKILAYTFLFVILCGFLYGCQSEQEKRGVSPIPFNRPASWEENPYGGKTSF